VNKIGLAMFDRKREVCCVDCGYCGFYINLGRDLKWMEMSQELRAAYEEGKEKQPPGQVPGTGHWNFVKCILETISAWESSSIDSSIKLSQALVSKRSCNRYFRYHAGFTPPEHYGLENSRVDLHLKQWNTWIAIIALVVAIISLVITLWRC